MSALKYVGRMGDSLLYSMGECKIILSGPSERAEIGWHFSISHDRRNPTWEEQKLARYQLVPDHVTMVSIMPPRAEYVNLDDHCFHWWEMDSKSMPKK